MKLKLALTPALPSIYGPPPAVLPARMRYLHPDALAALAGLLDWRTKLVLSDVFRDAGAQLVARRTKTGTQPVAFSGHNFGFSVDVAVGATCAARGVTYDVLLLAMAQAGWYCHRRDRKRGMEDWHFNWLRGSTPEDLGAGRAGSTWEVPLETIIEREYGADFQLDVLGQQKALAKLGFYGGAPDGLAGPLTSVGIERFQAAWDVAPGPMRAARTNRVLAYVAAEKLIVAGGAPSLAGTGGA